MRKIYDAVTRAISAHWKVHDKKYPQKMVLSPEQHAACMGIRNFGSDPGDEIYDAHFMDMKIEGVAGAPGHLVAVDDGQVALKSQTQSGK